MLVRGGEPVHYDCGEEDWRDEGIIVSTTDERLERRRETEGLDSLSLLQHIRHNQDSSPLRAIKTVKFLKSRCVSYWFFVRKSELLT